MIEETLLQSANELREALSKEPIPIFEPEKNAGNRLSLVAAIFVLFSAGIAFFALQKNGDDTQNQIASEITRTQSLSSAALQGVTNETPIPLSPMSRPTKDAVMEPDFETYIQALTKTKSQQAAIPLQVRPAWNSDGSSLLLYETGNQTPGHKLYETATDSTKKLPINPTDIEQVYWDPLRANILYYVEDTSLVQFDVAVGKKQTLHKFDGCEAISGIGSLRLSSNLTIGQLCIASSGNQLVSYNITTGKDIRSRTASSEAPQPTPNSNRFVSRDETGVVSVLDRNLQPTGVSFTIGKDPYVVVETARGDLLATVIFSGDTLIGSLVTFNLDTGEPNVIVGETTGYPYPPSGTYLGTSVANNALVSFATSSDTSGTDPIALEGEIVLVDLNATDDSVHRLAHHRSTGTSTESVWSNVHPALHPDGNAIAFASDWGQDHVDTFLLTSR